MPPAIQTKDVVMPENDPQIYIRVPTIAHKLCTHNRPGLVLIDNRFGKDYLISPDFLNSPGFKFPDSIQANPDYRSWMEHRCIKFVSVYFNRSNRRGNLDRHITGLSCFRQGRILGNGVSMVGILSVAWLQ